MILTVMPKKQFQLLILITAVGALFILLYSVQLRWDGYTNDTPTATLRSASTPSAVAAAGGNSDSNRHLNAAAVTGGGGGSADYCPVVSRYPAEIETSQLFPTFELNPSWMSRREFWSNAYEDRYTRRRQIWPQLPLKVILMPHSHTDPGWLKTVEQYFETSTKFIISNVVDKLTQHTNMTFILSEAAYVWRWWEQADPEDRQKFQHLVDSGRLEITTGGWVMTDEANVDFFSMVDQLVEGHEFMRRVVGVRPVNSWSVDSFGHGGAFPHLLSKAEISNMVIMRIHYIWKEWMARNQNGDFLWKQSWEKDGSRAPLCHNFPYDIYSIKHSCGPDPHTCLGFDFRHIDGEYNEFTMHYNPVHAGNIQTRAELLLDQYGRTGSLLPHNVVLVPLGDDFRYDKSIEFDQQYHNYMQIMQFINSGDYNAEVKFGTLKDYFHEVRNRLDKFPTLSGDFHVYSDIFSEGRPAYWSGYFFTRPYMKLLGRQVASKLKSVEIFYTLALAKAHREQHHLSVSALTTVYPKLVDSRRALALFQHHDAITGTSKEQVMNDYESRLDKAVLNLNEIERLVGQYLVQQDPTDIRLSNPLQHTNIRNKGEYDADAKPLNLAAGETKRLVLMNSEAFIVEKLASLMSVSQDLCVYDSSNTSIQLQVFPVHNTTKQSRLDTSVFQVYFVAILPPVSVSVYRVEECSGSRAANIQQQDPSDGQHHSPSKVTTVFCMRCPEGVKPIGSNVQLKNIPQGGIQLENRIYKLYFHPETKLLHSITNKIQGETHEVILEFGSYISQIFRSGAYLFSVENVDDIPTEDPVFTAADIEDVVIVSGPLYSELRVVWRVAGQRSPSTFVHSVRLTHDTGPLSEAVHIENLFDFGLLQNMNDKEMFMRFRTDIRNGGEGRRFYTDQAGLGMVERIHAEQPGLGLPGNLFPITESVYIEDAKTRLSLLVDHATGASSLKEGCLEVMVDKRTMHDDARGMGEGVLDSRLTRHRYTLMLEPRRGGGGDVEGASGQQPNKLRQDVAVGDIGGRGGGSGHVWADQGTSTTLPFLSTLGVILSRYLEHPVSLMLWTDGEGSELNDDSVELVTELPCGYELVNLRSWDPSRLLPLHKHNAAASSLPSALLIMRRLAPDCNWISLTTGDCAETGVEQFHFRNLNAVFRPVSLTGNFAVNLTLATPSSSYSSPPSTSPNTVSSLPTKQFSPMEILAFNVTFHTNQSNP